MESDLIYHEGDKTNSHFTVSSDYESIRVFS